MELKKLKLITIIAETILEEQICEELLSLGATGYTIVESKGHGSVGRKSGIFPGENIRIESIVNDEISTKILEAISKYFNDYSVVCYISDVSVLRVEKYTKAQ